MRAWLRSTVALAVLSVALASAPARGADKIRVAIPVLVAGYTMYLVAEDKGYFRNESLEVEIIEAGGGTATPALISGDLQFNGSPGVAISAILKGAQLKIVFVSSVTVPYQIWSGDPAVRSVADLEGKRVGVITLGDTHDLSVRMVMLAQGFNPRSAIVAAMGPGGGRFAGLQSGTLSAASLNLDEVDQAKSIPNMHMIADTQSLVKITVGGAATHERMLSGDRPLAKRFLRALIKGRRYVAAFEDEAVDALQKRKPKTPREALVAASRLSVAGLTKDGTEPLSVLRREIEVRAELLGIAKDKIPGPEKVYDFSILNEINRELDAEGWKPTR